MANVIENFIGVEVGTLNEFEVTAGTVSAQTSIKRSGAYALRVNPTGTNAASCRVSGLAVAGTFTSIAANTAYVGFWFRHATLPASNDEEILRWVNNTVTLKCTVRITSTGTLKLYNISGTNTATSSTALSANTWYRIYCRAANSTSGIFEVKIYDSAGTLLETITDSACDMGATNIGRVTLGKVVNQNGNDVDFYYDDIWLDSSDYPPTGLWQIDYLPIVSDNTNQWTGGTGASDYTQISERPASTSEYIADPAATAPVTYAGNLSTFASAGINSATTINSLKALALAVDPVATANTFAMGLDSTLTSNSNVTNTNPNVYGKIFSVHPGGGLPWTRTQVEGSKFTVVENTSSEDIRVSWGGLFVLHTPPANTNNGRFFSFFQ